MVEITAVRIVKHSAYDEWIVRTYTTKESGALARYSNGDYFTDDFVDAKHTAQAILGLPSDFEMFKNGMYSK